MRLPAVCKLPYFMPPMAQTIEKPIVIRVPGVSNARGRVVRVVGNSVAYVSLESGDSLAFSAEDIEHYGGQTFRHLGVYEGAPVWVTNNPVVESGVSVNLNRTTAVDPQAQLSRSLVNPEVEAMINAAVKEIPAEVWEAIGLAQRTVPVQPVEYAFSHVGACDAFESRH